MTIFCPTIIVLPKGTCCCLQTCNFDVSFMLMSNVCVQSLDFVRASMSKLWKIFCPFNKVLPEGICCCLQTCNFDVICILMNNVCVQSFNFIRASMCKL